MAEIDEKSMTAKKLAIMVVEIVLILIIAIVLVGVIEQYLIVPIKILGSSMSPTMRSSGDFVLVYRLVKNYKIGDVIVFYKPAEMNNIGDIELNDESTNPASKKVTFTEFLRSLPIIGSRIQTNDDNSGGDHYKAVIKRIVACPGDTVCFINGELYVNGNKEDRFAHKFNSVAIGNEYTHTMGKGEYFVMGDNRGDSHDSENYGPILESMIYGKAVVLFTDGKPKTSF